MGDGDHEGAAGEHEPELVPVSASVFDDEFFRVSSARARAGEENASAKSAVPNGAGAAREPHAAAQVEQGEADELDIPAFLRRSH
jgi:cell division protein FtsZ